MPYSYQQAAKHIKSIKANCQKVVSSYKQVLHGLGF